MGKSAHSTPGRMLREASSAGAESAVTGAPIDEVTGLRAERRAGVRAAGIEALEAYNDAVHRVAERGAPSDVADRWLAMENLRRIGRRDFLKGAGAAAIALAAATAQPRQIRAASGKQPSIAIVGGGLAGLRAAHMLWTKYGWTSKVYEAGDRIGGRVETQRGYWANGLIAEMHGEYISSEHASMLNLVKAFNLSLDDTRAYAAGTDDTYWVNGGRYTQAQLNADWQTWARTLFNNAVKTVPWPQRYNAYNATGYQWDRMSVPAWMNQYMPGGTAGNFAATCLQSQIDEYGGDPSDQSALNLTFILGYYDSANGRAYQPASSPYLAGTDERWHVTGGNDQIVTGMANQLPAGTIQTGQVLIALKANANGTYTLTFQSGASTRQVTVNSVILALPFVTLRNVDLSGAGLPTLKTTAINTQGMGTNAKLILEFRGQPWIAGGYTGTTYQDNGFISSGWQLSQSAAVGGYTAPTSLWTAYPGGSGTQGIVNTYGLTADSGVPPAKLVNDTLKQLEPVLPGVTAGYTGKAWYDFGILDTYCRGGYSYYRVGQYTSISGYEAVPIGRIHFAGEHTTPDFQGFMEGAVLSGERCAAEVQPNG